MLCFLGYLKYSNEDGNIVILKKKKNCGASENEKRAEGRRNVSLPIHLHVYSFNGVLWHRLTVSDQLFQSVIMCFRLWQKIKANLL